MYICISILSSQSTSMILFWSSKSFYGQKERILWFFIFLKDKNMFKEV